MPTALELVTAAAQKDPTTSSRAHTRLRATQLGDAVEREVASVCSPVRTKGGRVSRLGRSGHPRYGCARYAEIARHIGIDPDTLDAVRSADDCVSSRTRVLVYHWLAAKGVNPFVSQ